MLLLTTTGARVRERGAEVKVEGAFSALTARSFDSLDMADNTKLRSIWFESGANALEVAGLLDGQSYVCPLCLMIFTRDQIQDLSIEDVPPKSLGGKPLVVTCRKCNSEAGFKIDSHAAHYEEVLRFFSGKGGDFRRTRLSVGNLNINTLAHFGGGVVVLNRKDSNPPGSDERLEDAFRAFSDLERNASFSISYSPRAPVNQFRVGLSRLRLAYLAAFALLGYTFIFREIFTPIRKQISHPEEENLTHTGITVFEDQGPEMGFLVVQQPTWLRSLAVKMQRRVIFLPLFDDTNCIYTALREHFSTNENLQLKANLHLPWPTKPEYRLDLCSPAEAESLIQLMRSAAQSPATKEPSPTRETDTLLG